jgi:hypothetical protein
MRSHGPNPALLPAGLLFLVFLAGCTTEVVRVEVEITVDCDGECTYREADAERLDGTIYLGSAHCSGDILHQYSCGPGHPADPVLQLIYSTDGHEFDFEYHNTIPAILDPVDAFCLERDFSEGDEDNIAVVGVLLRDEVLYEIYEEGQMTVTSDFAVADGDEITAEYSLSNGMDVVEVHRFLGVESLRVEHEGWCQCSVLAPSGEQRPVAGAAGLLALLVVYTARLVGRRRSRG